MRRISKIHEFDAERIYQTIDPKYDGDITKVVDYFTQYGWETKEINGRLWFIYDSNPTNESIIENGVEKQISRNEAVLLEDRELIYYCGCCGHWHLTENTIWEYVEQELEFQQEKI